MMLPNIALFGSLLLASVAQATPSDPIPDAIVRYGGVFIRPPAPDNVTFVTGSMRIPLALTGNEGDQVHFLIGVGGFDTGCSSSTFQLGVIGTICASGNTSYNTSYHNPGRGWTDVSLHVSPGDDIVMSIIINPSDMTSGYGIISDINKTHIKGVNFTTGPFSPLCSRSAGWSIQTVQTTGNVTFGTVEFLYASVQTVDGKMYFPGDQNVSYVVPISDGYSDVLYNIQPNGNNITASPPQL